jgi:hypothetical protein
MKSTRTQKISNDHPAYSLNLIINSDHPGLLDSSAQFIAPSLFSFEQNGEFIPGYPAVNMDAPRKQPRMLFTVRDLAGDKELAIEWWRITVRAEDPADLPFVATFPVTSEDVEKDVIGHKQEKDYYSYTIFETTFKAPPLNAQSYRFTMEMRVSKGGVVLPFASDPEMIIDDQGPLLD